MKNVLKKVLLLLALLLWAGGLICILVVIIKTKALVPIMSAILIGLMSLPSAIYFFGELTE